MESLGYVAMYLLRGKLPWQGLQESNKSNKYELIKEKKLSMSLDALCLGYPDEFKKYLKYCRNLDYEEKPNYSEMRKMFKDLFHRQGYSFDYKYDWVILNEKREKMG